MLPLERPFQHHHTFQQTFVSEPVPLDSYPATTMEYDYSATAYNNNFVFDFVDPPSAPIDFHGENSQFDMSRTVSNNSMEVPLQDFSPALLSSESIRSGSSSTVSSPYSGHVSMIPVEHYFAPQPCLSQPTIFCDDLQQEYNPVPELGFPDQENKMTATPFISMDPHMLPDSRESLFAPYQYGHPTGYPQQAYSGYASSSAAPSPVPSHNSHSTFRQPVTVDSFPRLQRGTSIASNRSGGSPTSISGDDESAEKGRCPHPDCGRVFKDLKAHMLTHQQERPEKCPIQNCEYHIKGFARKYDKNRHTLTHYKGTMICGFCPGSGSSAEKSFNRADVFKRHLTTVHGVEQNPPNSKRRSPAGSNKKLSSYCQDATGKCSTCSALFNNAQDFYEHLDDCVLRIVQQEEPSEAINQQHLATIATDPALQETLSRHMIKQEDTPQPFGDEEDFDNDEDDEEDDDEDEEDAESFNERCGKGTLKSSKRSGSGAVIRGGHIFKSKSNKKGMTRSKIGVPLVGKGRKRRKHYPPSWGMAADKMKMRKRVLCVFDGQRRLLKDDMMLNDEFEVRMPLPDGNSYVTDLDVETLKRAQAFHDATPEEKGPWIPEQDLFTDLMS